MAKRDKKTITLGSGKLYLVPYTDELPDYKTMCTDENLLGYIKGGAALEYTEEPHEEKDDLGIVSKIIVLDEAALFKCGLLTWNGTTLTKLLDRCTSTEADGIRTTKIGGAGNSQGKYYALCFHHADKRDGDLWVQIVGRNQAGATLTFATDAGTVIEPEFKAMPHDEDGTLVQIHEEIGTATT